MKPKITLIVAAALACCAAIAPAEKIRYYPLSLGKAKFHVVVANLSQRDLSVETILSSKAKSPWYLLKNDTPSVAITGTFFNPADSRPVGDIIIDGQRKVRGSRGSVFGVDWEGNPRIVDTGFNRTWDYTDYRFALRATVRIIKDGVVCPDPRAQKFKDPRIWGRAARTAAGITEDGRLVLMATRSNVTLSELGKAMKSRGVVDAVNLDGGSSTCLYVKGKMVISPTRRLTNLIVLRDRAPMASQASY